MGRRKIVLATGVFDLLHLGHVRFLEESRKKGGQGARLVVVVARDRTVQTLKGHRPVVPENQRRALVASLRAVDRAILWHEPLGRWGILREVKPDVICVGYDQKDVKRSVQGFMKREGLDIPIFQIPKFGPYNLNSSSKVKKRVAERMTISS